MNGWLGGALAAAVAVGVAVAANLVGDEISGRLDLLARAVIWLAGRRVPAHWRRDLTDEWLAELAVILRPAADLPVTRLVAGLRYALGVLLAARAITAELSGVPPRLGRRGSRLNAALAAGCGALTAVLWGLSGRITAAGAIPVLAAFPLLAVRWAMAQSREQSQTGEAMMAVFCQTIEAKDVYTLGHCQRVSERSVLIARELGLRSDRVEALRQAALLHDAGKLGVAPEILGKATALSEDECSAMQMHCVRGLEIGRDMGLASEVLDGITHHHERIDGRGYPMGLAGDEIPEFARIIAVADAFDSMTCTRSYRQARSIQEAVSGLQKGAGSQFDPVTVHAFIRVLSREGWLLGLQRDGGGAAAC